MIVLDIETSGLNLVSSGIWQIGAIETETGREFIEEARIDDEDQISEESLKVTGKTVKELRDLNKQSKKELVSHFFDFIENSSAKNILCHNPAGLDVPLLSIKAGKYGFKVPYSHKSFDLHTLASLKYFQINKEFLIKEGKSDFGLSKVLEFCGIIDERRAMKEGKLVKEGKPHNALEDAKLTAECFSRIVYGKNLLKEYAKFAVPNYLKNDNL